MNEGYYWHVNAKVFKKFLQVRGLSIRKVADISGLGRYTIQRILDEERVSLRTLSTLVRTLGASPTIMFGPDDDPDLKELRDILKFVG